MKITTIEQALRDMGNTIASDAMSQRARDAVKAGDTLEITVLVSPAKDGVDVTMHSLVAHDRASHGRLIKLS